MPKLKPNDILINAIALVLTVLLGMRIGTALTEFPGKDLIVTALNDALARPQHIVLGLPQTFQFGAYAFFIYAVTFLYIQTNKKNLMQGKEHGTAEWGNHKDIASIIDSDDDKNILFTESEKMSLDTHKTRKNLNVMVIGGSGSGKTRFFVKPNIMQRNTSYIITDPKGELLSSTSGLLAEAGYKIRVFNLIDMAHSNCYNPFAYLKEDKDVMRLIRTLIKNTTPPNAQANDPFWEKSETALLMALVYYLFYEAPPEEQNFSMIMELLRAAEVRETDENFESDLDRLFNMLEEKDPNHVALKQYKVFKQAAGQTAKSILVSASVRLAPFNIRDIGALTIDDNIDLDKIGDEKTVLYAVIPDSHDTYNFIVAMMYSQVFESLFYKADFEYGGRLPVHVRFLLDEFANIGQIPDFEKMVATIRSREISTSIIIQNLAQLKTMYKDSWESITGNCDSTLFLGGQEQSTLEYISKALGKKTIDTKTTSKNKGKSGGTTVNFNIHGRELMMPDEIGRMPDNTCILMMRGMRPFKSHKIVLEKHKMYGKLFDGKGAQSYDYRDHFATPYDKLDHFFNEFK
ncbi:MAG: type IV secretory system conjugative DNA transfer family protein [Clostridiales bacterium]|jgi:type IV secretion system protein VirD4|nr:type IV secretory system conjugative DNA transfer family protein [Clostridiales bacterium]